MRSNAIKKLIGLDMGYSFGTKLFYEINTYGYRIIGRGEEQGIREPFNPDLSDQELPKGTRSCTGIQKDY